MSFVGVLVNTLTVLIGSTVGLLFKKKLPEKLTAAVMPGLGLVTLVIGISGALKGENTLILIAAVVLGAVIGTLLDIDRGISRLGEWVGAKCKHEGNRSTVGEGFVTASLLFCIGAMTVVGSLNAGLTGDNEMLLTKSMLDLVSSCMLAASLGVGVLFSAAFVLVFQGALVLLAGCLQSVLTPSAINELVCVGSVLIIGLGLNLLGVTKLKIANYFPAIVIAPVLAWVVSLPAVQQLFAGLEGFFH